MELETPSPARSVVEAVLLDPDERSKLIRYARVRFGIDGDTAEDLLQETALDLLRQQRLVRSPKGFVFTVFLPSLFELSGPGRRQVAGSSTSRLAIASRAYRSR